MSKKSNVKKPAGLAAANGSAIPANHQVRVDLRRTSRNRQRYWVCIIGPIPDNKLPIGADLPMRMAARRAALDTTGVNAVCNSGWEDAHVYERILAAKYAPGCSRVPRKKSLNHKLTDHR